MKIKTREADGLALNYLVTLVEGGVIEGGIIVWRGHNKVAMQTLPRDYCGDWADGGPIIEKYGISVGTCTDGQWGADMDQVPNQGENYAIGPTPLKAALRCYVISKLGEEAELPDGLL